MSYLEDYESSSYNKIPYDDIPITRNTGSSRRSPKRGPVTVNKILICAVAVMFVINIVLCSLSVYFLNHSKVKEVNTYHYNINGTSESISTIASSTAWQSSICVAAGGNVSPNNPDTFFANARSRGSGVIYRIAEDNRTIYFITCYHVIRGYEDKVWVLIPSQLKPFSAEVVSYSSRYDIAVLKYKSPTTAANVLDGCKPVEVSDSTYLSVGEDVFAVGNPLSNGFSVTKGVVSRINTLITVDSNNYESREIQTDASINPGNSGGGLFNYKGKFIGLVNAKLNTSKTGTTTITVAGTAYAIPGTLVCSIAESIINNNGKATYVNLGIELKNDLDRGVSFKDVNYDDDLKMIHKHYVTVSSVVENSIAYRKLHTGDVINSIEISVYEAGKVVNKVIDMYNIYTLEDYSFAIVGGSEIKFNIDRNGINPAVVTVIASSFSHIQGE